MKQHPVKAVEIFVEKDNRTWPRLTIIRKQRADSPPEERGIQRTENIFPHRVWMINVVYDYCKEHSKDSFQGNVYMFDLIGREEEDD